MRSTTLLILFTLCACSHVESTNEIANPIEGRDGITFGTGGSAIQPLPAADWAALRSKLSSLANYRIMDVTRITNSIVVVELASKNNPSKGLHGRFEKKNDVWVEIETYETTITDQ
jgi:hypothetical protein